MSIRNKSFFLSDDGHRYLVTHGTPPDDVLSALIEETEALGPIAVMQIAPEQGAFLTMLTRLMNAKRAIEIGTFTGYSAICIARGLSPGGLLTCCDSSEEWTAIAQRYWKRAGVDDRIELRLGPAVETLPALPATADVDLAFLDADKVNYPLYYEELLIRMRAGGLILIDNVLQSGEVVDAARDSENVRIIRAFNEQVASDDRVETVMLPIADGLTLLRTKS